MQSTTGRTLCLLIFGILFITLASSFAQSHVSHEAEVKRLAQPLIDGHLIPGLVIGIYDDGKIETYGLGVIAKDEPSPPDANTIYEIGSVTKVFTSLLLAEAVTRGEVSLDTPLSRLLPSAVKPPKHDGKEMTLEELATHCSGLPRIPSNMVADSLVNPYADFGREKLFTFLDGYKASRKPGKEWAYSNLGVGLMGILLADKAGLTYGNLLQERIAKPLAMADTLIILNTNQQLRLAPPHRGGMRVTNWDFDALAGCGAIRSSVNDLLKFVAAQVNPSATPFKNSIPLTVLRRCGIPGSAASMGLGWWIAGDGGTLFHNGQTGGYSSSMFVNPRLKKGVVVLANGADSTVDQLGEKIFQSLAGMKVQPLKIRASIAIPETQLDQLVGEYPSALGFTITITRNDDALFAQLTGQQALRVYAESAAHFYYREVEADLQFETDPKTSRANAVTLLQNGKKMRCPRKS